MKIAVGLSGGVDSAVTAAYLIEQGHEVTGVSMSIWNGPDGYITEGNACYGPDEKEDLEAAAQIAELLKIPFHVFPISNQYEDTVLSHFKGEYAEGRTPNPCVICNAKMKFGALPDQMLKSGIDCDKIATGHYARIEYDEAAGAYNLLEAVDKKKDQTYFLHRLKRDALSSILFPIGHLTKETVREMAREWSLPVHDKKDSKGFFSGDYRQILEFPDQDGEIVDIHGTVHGSHKGIWNFTIGQRKGLNIEDKNLFVLRLDKKNNRVVIGEREHLYRSEFVCRDMNWLLDISEKEIEVDVKIGNTHPRAQAVIQIDDDSVRVCYSKPQVAIAPGQSSVFYIGEKVLGGGFITNVSDNLFDFETAADLNSVFSR